MTLLLGESYHDTVARSKLPTKHTKLRVLSHVTELSHFSLMITTDV